MIDVQRLRVFRAVVASGSVQAAADHLGYTPSAVSQQIAALQRETGLVLFEKSGRGIAPTAAARVLASESDEVMESLSRLGGVVDHLRDGRSSSLTIATFASAAQSWVPAVAKGLRRDFPDLLLDLALAEISADNPGVRRDLEIATEDADAEGIERPGHSRHVLTEETYRVVAPRGHELLTEWDEQVPMLALAGQPLIDNDFQLNDTCSLIIRNACRAAGFSPRYVARSDDHHTALSFVAAGVGVTLLPALAVPESMAGVDSRELVNPVPRRRIVVHVRDAVAGSPPVVRALELLDEAVAKTVARRTAAAH